jgi:hypothetical protein
MIACHACDEAIRLEPIGPRDVCDRCQAYLHCCKQCDFYEPGAHNDCREPQAEMIADKNAGNFCDWFRAVPSPKRAASSHGARAALDRLFRRS